MAQHQIAKTTTIFSWTAGYCCSHIRS